MKYRVTFFYSMTETAYVEAESEDEAWEKVEAGDYDVSGKDVGECHSTEIEEA